MSEVETEGVAEEAVEEVSGSKAEKGSKRTKRLLRVFLALDEHPLIGIGSAELAEGLGIPQYQVSRDLKDLTEAGLVVKLDNGNYAYGIKTLQIAERFRKQQERLNARLQELEKRIY